MEDINNQTNWASLHDSDTSWRSKKAGPLAQSFILPRYLKLFFQRFGNLKSLDFLELGAGNGEVSELILKNNNGCIRKYIASDFQEKLVFYLKNKGLEAKLINAEDIPEPDASFDVVLSFDAMHHVKSPEIMPKEMMIVGR